MKTKTNILILNAAIILLAALHLNAQTEQNITHTIVAIEDGQFLGWPANNGIWVWGNEILVGFTKIEYDDTEGHNIKKDATRYSLLSRSTDGGRSWKVYDPDNFVGDNLEKKELVEPIDFRNRNFVMRIEGDKYHGSVDYEGAIFYSYDRGKNWNGPYKLGEVAGMKRFEGYILTPRTDYIVTGDKECLIMISSRVDGTGMSDKISVIKTTDGGKSFTLHSPWVVPCSDPYRAVMPNTVRVSDNEYVMAVRRRVINDGDNTWIDCYSSDDGAKTWQFESRIADAGFHNGNPPALARLSDGRLCAVYGNRTTRHILGRYSSDNGKTWEPEFVVRDDFYTGETGDMKDLGYSRLVQNANGELVAVYYWATEENKEQHIAASIWKP